MKTCTRCGETKSLDDFHRQKSKPDGRRSHCKVCRAAEYLDNADDLKAAARERYAADPEKVKTKVNAWGVANPERVYWSKRKGRWREQGIVDVDTLDWVDILESQGYACKVCGATIDHTAIRDHDHETGLTRAAVCSPVCNLAMDRLQ